MVPAEKPSGMASQPFTAAPPPFQIVLSLFSRMACSGARGVQRSKGSAVECRALRVEGPARDKILHGDGIVTRAEAVLPVELVRLLHLGHVELDADPGP